MIDGEPVGEECEPPELLPIMPPSVARFEVEVSGPNRKPIGRTWWFSSSCTSPGCTRAHCSSTFTSITWFMNRVKSIDQRPVHRLAGERRAAAAGQQRDFLLSGHGDGGADVVRIARDDDTDRLHLVHGGVGGVEELGALIEPDVTADDATERVLEVVHAAIITGRVETLFATEPTT